jgi:hypothetical protein
MAVFILLTLASLEAFLIPFLSFCPRTELGFSSEFWTGSFDVVAELVFKLKLLS